ncbi:MAG: penicillin-binding protein 2 [Oscillatoriales cyanobacterium RM2_1_1]|nr:penicillin-binding protein 2 [Oscillatoriales cyanobacterium SM2_3_0]NJO44863.1 penicillin-binding protein 2 [Oscillatoriales cyanobacterium RM2_1_1]
MVRQLSFGTKKPSVDQFQGSVAASAAPSPNLVYRALLLMLLVTTTIGLHIHRLTQLQLIAGNENRQRAEENRIRPIPLPASRGAIFDRHGKLLAANQMTRSVYLWPKEQTREQWQKAIPQLSRILGISAESILAKLEKVNYRSASPVRIARQITPEAFIWIGEKSGEFPGVEIRNENSRYYPNQDLASQVIGYIGEATQADLEAHPDYPMGMIVGQLGIEASSNEKLAGVWGARIVEVDARNEELQFLGEKPAVAGQPLTLTLDLDLQKTAEQALGNRLGAVVALNVKTGEVLAMASSPRFDLNLFTKPISSQQWENLQNENKPFLNRTLQGYPPGSTFKIVSSAAGMGSGKFSPWDVIATSASIVVGNLTFHEHGEAGYGVIGFRDALTVSSNTFFYRLGLEVGPDELAKWANLLGIENTDLKLLQLNDGGSGFIPNPARKEQLLGEPWYSGDTVTMAIGQGSLLATPLELAVMVSTIANGGNRVRPHLLAALTNTPATQPIPTGLTAEMVNTIRDGLIDVVRYGTGQGLNDGSIPLTGGKTGTSEVQGQESHSLYVAFGPAEKPEVAIAVVVENGGYGAESAAPVAKQVFQTYFKTGQVTPSEEAIPEEF